MFDTAFRKMAKDFEPLGEPYILSLCAHSPDQSYEAQHGLLSQWRAYGRAERFCIVFDAAKFINLLSQEFEAYSWVYLRLAETCYSSDPIDTNSLFPHLLRAWADHIAARFRGVQDEISINMLIDFLSAAT